MTYKNSGANFASEIDILDDGHFFHIRRVTEPLKNSFGSGNSRFDFCFPSFMSVFLVLQTS